MSIETDSILIIKQSTTNYTNFTKLFIVNQKQSNTNPSQLNNNISYILVFKYFFFSPHPYLFFNQDGHSMTFLGFNIDKRTGNLVDLQTKTILEEGIMGTQLFNGLRRNNVNLTENYDTLPR